MKKVCFFMLLFASSVCFAEVPQWVKTPEKTYPTSKYIRAIGEGTSIKSAQNAALADISLFFNTQIEVITVAIEKMKQENKEQFSSSQSYEQTANISSTAEFFGVKFTDAYYDKKHDKYSVLGYIDKDEAAQVYKSHISSLMQTVNSYRESAKKEKEPFLQVSSLAKAKKASDLAQQYINIETIIFPADTQKFQKELIIISLIPSELDELKKQMTFSITMNQGEKKFSPIFSCVAGILESKGCSYSEVESKYKIIIDLSCIEENYEAGPFVRASTEVLIENADGNGVYSYSKAFPRTGSTTMEKAYTRAVTKIKQDFEENLLTEFE